MPFTAAATKDCRMTWMTNHNKVAGCGWSAILGSSYLSLHFRWLLLTLWCHYFKACYQMQLVHH